MLIVYWYNENMNPEKNESLPPVAPLAEQPPAPLPGEEQPNKPKGPPKWVWLVIIGAIIVLVGIVVLVVSLMVPKNTTTGSGDSGIKALTKLTIGSQTYVYPCSVATEADYARIFKLDDNNVGTVSETSAMPVGSIISDTPNLEKFAPPLSNGYVTDCNYTLAKQGASTVNRIAVSLEQYADEAQATKRYNNARMGESGDFTSDGVDNGDRQLGTLPAFPDKSFVRLPEADSVLPGLKATYLSGTRLVKLDYSFGKDETTDSVLPLLDEYARAIQSKLNSYKEGSPVDLTNRNTFVNKKFVDICSRLDYAKLSETFDAVQFRPDEMTQTNTYGSLEGSRAAADGASSSCTLDFNTKGDRKSQEKQGSGELTASDIWPQSVNLVVNTLRSPQEAKAYLAAKKIRAATPVPDTGTPAVEDVKDLGDGAYKNHREWNRETMHSGKSSQIATTEDVLAVVSGSDVITITMTQYAQSTVYPTAPDKVTDSRMKKAFEQIHDLIAETRK
jgi:hypothetical protein